MFCPFCKSEETKVVDKRDNLDTGVTRRRRECLGCSKRFTTYERIETVPLNVEKRSGKIEDFDRSKLKSSIYKAIKKRTISETEVDEIIDDIEQKILAKGSNTVSTQVIGQMVLDKLRKLDKVAYLRYVSVYHDFDTIEKFEEELLKLKDVV